MTTPDEQTVYLIRKHGGYYRPNSEGYTDSAIIAGRFTLEDAISITHPNGPKGPRDGMTYVHEDEVKDEDWLFHRAAIAAMHDTKALEAADRLADAYVSLCNMTGKNYHDHDGSCYAAYRAARGGKA